MKKKTKSDSNAITYSMISSVHPLEGGSKNPVYFNEIATAIVKFTLKTDFTKSTIKIGHQTRNQRTEMENHTWISNQKPFEYTPTSISSQEKATRQPETAIKTRKKNGWKRTRARAMESESQIDEEEQQRVDWKIKKKQRCLWCCRYVRPVMSPRRTGLVNHPNPPHKNNENAKK